MLLTKKALECPTTVAAHLEKNLEQVLGVVRSGSDDAREYAVMLLSVYAKEPKTKSQLVELNAFNVLCRFLMCSNEEMRNEFFRTGLDSEHEADFIEAYNVTQQVSELLLKKYLVI